MNFSAQGLRRLAQYIDNPVIQTELETIAAQKSMAAIVSQAIADNFDKEGPGWAPLKGETLRTSMKDKGAMRAAKERAADEMHSLKISAKTGKRTIQQNRLRGQLTEFHERVGKHLKIIEADRRKAGLEPGRRILQRSGLLKRTATTPGYQGSITNEAGKTVSGSNIYRVEGTKIVWGTSLIYAKTHNEGMPSRNIPTRKFLVIREEWKALLYRNFYERALEIIDRALAKGRA